MSFNNPVIRIPSTDTPKIDPLSQHDPNTPIGSLVKSLRAKNISNESSNLYSDKRIPKELKPQNNFSYFFAAAIIGIYWILYV